MKDFSLKSFYYRSIVIQCISFSGGVLKQVEAGDLFVNDSLHNWLPWFKISQI